MDLRRRNGPQRAIRRDAPASPPTVEDEIRLSTVILDALCDAAPARSPTALVLPTYLALLRIHHEVDPSYSMTELHDDLSRELAAELDAIESRGWCFAPSEDDAGALVARIRARACRGAPN